MKYPDWYIKYYDDIFKRSTYSEEISKVNYSFPLKDKIVLEIGSGKGYHAEEILFQNPKSLKLIDYQKEAIEALKMKFINEPSIELIQANAFKISLKSKVDIALVFFSVLPQVNTYAELRYRINHTFDNLIKPNGILAFEFIDYEISLNVYPNNIKTLIFQNNEAEVYIKTSYLSEILVIEYFGKINNEPLKYSVNLLKLNNEIINDISKDLRLEQVNSINLDINGRRKLSFLKRPATKSQYK